MPTRRSAGPAATAIGDRGRRTEGRCRPPGPARTRRASNRPRIAGRSQPTSAVSAVKAGEGQRRAHSDPNPRRRAGSLSVRTGFRLDRSAADLARPAGSPVPAESALESGKSRTRATGGAPAASAPLPCRHATCGQDGTRRPAHTAGLPGHRAGWRPCRGIVPFGPPAGRYSRMLVRLGRRSGCGPRLRATCGPVNGMASCRCLRPRAKRPGQAQPTHTATVRNWLTAKVRAVRPCAGGLRLSGDRAGSPELKPMSGWVLTVVPAGTGRPCPSRLSEGQPDG